MGDDEITYYNWSDLFSEICYAHEAQYPPHYHKDYRGVEAITFHKLTICSDGEMEYKGQISRFDPVLWPKVKLVYKTFEEGSAIDILYNNAKQD
jgi:hypothetical protein